MGAALSDDDAFDFCAAFVAGIAGPLIYLEIVLEIPAAIDPINARAIATYGFFENLADVL